MPSHTSVWRLSASTSFAAVALVIAGPAFAQTVTDPGATQAEPVAETPAETTDIIVTGSRIRRPDFDSPSPIVSVTAAQIQQAGTTNLTDFLTGYPALIGSSTSHQNSGDLAGIGATGLNLLNLRNLGTERTLVLINGKRQVASVPGEQSIDINTIPSDLIESIDVLTGGASAIYGADGVTGVVNFKLKQNFEGVSARGQAGISEKGDSGQRLLSLTIGKNFADGRGNIALSYEYGAEDRLTQHDRKRLSGLSRQVFVPNPDDLPDADGHDNPNLPDRIPLRNVRYGTSAPGGAIDINGDYFPEFTSSGGIFDNGLDLTQGFVQGGDSTLVSDYGNDLLPQVRRNIFNGIAHFDISDKITLYAEGKYANVRSFSLGQPTFDYGIFVEADNPYVPANIRAAIDPSIGGVLVNRDNFDLGQRGEDIRRQTYSGVIGAKGDISDSFHYDVSFTYGETKVRSQYVNDIYNDRFFAAIDAVRDPVTGTITCRANLDPNWVPNQPYESGRNVQPRMTFQPGQCTPINLFGVGNSNPTGVDFIHATTTDYSTIKQQVLSGSISGDFRQFFSLPGGPIGFAFGAEYRKEDSSFNPDPIEQQGLTFTNVLSPTKGTFHVTEFFGELNAPLIKDRPFFHDLELGAAIRVSDYSTIGRTTTWKVDGMYSPIRDITFRGTYSVAIRAPNIGELFSGNSQTFEFFNDPCRASNLDQGTSYRATNCQTLLTGLGADPAHYDDNRSTNISGVQGGNPSLTEEKAKTWTAGIVLAPRFIPGLTLSADWYDIRLENAINTVKPQQLAELCVDQPSLQNIFCSSITRQQGAAGNAAAGNILGFTVMPQNVASFQTAGLDLNINYLVRTAHLGTFNIRAVGGYLNKLNFVGTPGADPTDERGTSDAFAPKYQANLDVTWNSGPVTLNYGLSWFDKTLRYSKLIMAGDPDYVAPEYVYYKARWQHDIYAAFDVDKRFQFFMGVNNVFNQEPDVGANTYPVSSVGRYIYAGAKVKLPKF
ncbi:TonB-dependent receptor plug domain-containing protein [Sphingomonas sp.]|uniref:TonB-dependent receptor plug domain-containing protein n=1 Tax=Sphingomonas sp. TaxID=28214 RepID=UPI003D6D47ED